MAQGKFKAVASKKREKSLGAKRKKVGQSGKSKGSSNPRHNLRDAALKTFGRAVEADLAAKLPSDQRDKLTVLRDAPLRKGLEVAKKKNGKKPLTRGRTRKGDRQKGKRMSRS
jgi:hypothetical protein